MLLILRWDITKVKRKKQFSPEAFSHSNVSASKHYFASFKFSGMLSMYRVPFPIRISLTQNASFPDIAYSIQRLYLSPLMYPTQWFPTPCQFTTRSYFALLKYLLKLCQTRCTTTNHLCQITHHQFWNGKCWTPTPQVAATVRLQEASERSKLLRSCCWKLPPPSFPGQCHGGTQGGMITQLPLRTFQTVCVQSRGHTRKSRYWRGRGPLFRMATFSIPLSMLNSRTTHGVL